MPRPKWRPSATSTSWRCSCPRPAPTSSPASTSAGTAPDPATYVGRGQGPGAAHHLRVRPTPTPSSSTTSSRPAQSRNLEKILGPHRDRPHGRRSSTSSPRTPAPRRARPRSSWPSSSYRSATLCAGRGVALSQQAGRIGTRGPGETQLEVDRRRLVQPRAQAGARAGPAGAPPPPPAPGPCAAAAWRRCRLVGYTNAGKSTLLNLLTGAGVVADERLFATLDPRTRRFALPGGEPVLLSDTVGFVRKLPHQLVEAFRSTLEVVNEADLLVHLVDSSAPGPRTRSTPCGGVLAEIGAVVMPELLVFNKADVAPQEAKELAVRFEDEGPVVISARTGDGVGGLLGTVGERLRAASRVVELVVPYNRGDVLAALHREGEVLSSAQGADATLRSACPGSTAPPSSASPSSSQLGGWPGARCARRRGAGGGAVSPAGGGFQPPPYPYDRLTSLRASAAALPGGAVDLSVGSPCDPPSPAVLAALAAGDEGWATRGYPASAGSAAARQAAADWMRSRLGLDVGPEVSHFASARKSSLPGCQVGCTCGTRRAIRSSTRPSLTRPTRWGRSSLGCGRWRSGRRALRGSTWGRSRRPMPNVPSCCGPTAPPTPPVSLDDLAAAAAWGRERGALVASDECYAELTWNGPQRTVLGHSDDGGRPRRGAGSPLALEAEQPRRLALWLVRRRPAGGQVPPGGPPARRFHGPRGGPARRLPLLWPTRPTPTRSGRSTATRLARLRLSWPRWGRRRRCPGGGIYLWAPAPGGDAWALAARLAEKGGLIVSAGGVLRAGRGRLRARCGSRPDGTPRARRLPPGRPSPAACAPAACLGDERWRPCRCSPYRRYSIRQLWNCRSK